MAKTRLTKAKREKIVSDIKERLDVGELRVAAATALVIAYAAVQAAVERKCPKKITKFLRSITAPVNQTTQS